VTQGYVPERQKAPGQENNMNESERMEIALLLDDAAQTMVEVVKLLQNRLTADDLETNGAFNGVCSAKLQLIRDAVKTGFNRIVLERETTSFHRAVETNRGYGYSEGFIIVDGRPTCVNVNEPHEPLMTYGPTALAKAKARKG